jgi:hypothetical protein
MIMEAAGPFGTPDGSRADINAVLSSFVRLHDHPGFGAVATRADDASVRVIVGRMGAGKTVYMRRLFSFQQSSPAVYTDPSPWSGRAYNRECPDGNMRALPFGPDGEGFVVYLILEDQRRVVVLRVMWLG